MPTQGEPIRDTAKPRISVRTWAVLLVLAVVVPLLLFGWMTLRSMTQSHADAFTKTQIDTARGLALDVDDELHDWKEVLTTLAESKSLAPGRLAEFYEEARPIAARHEGWIVLTDSAGQQHLNTLRPYGASLPMTGTPEFLRAVVNGGQPVVSDLVFGKVSQRWIISVAVPVVRDGKVAYMLDMAFTPDRLTRLLQRQPLPPGWVVAIQDSQHRVVTRLPLTEDRMGKPIQPWFEAALRSRDHGMATGPLADGVPGRVAFNRLTEAPWFVALAIPLAAFPSARPVQWFMLLGGLLGLGALGLAVYVSRKLTRPVAELAARAERVLQGDAMDVGPVSGVREIQHLQQALVTAATHVQALQHEQARVAIAEERAKVAAETEEALRQAHHELEGRVQERTADLARAVATLEHQAAQLRALAAELTRAEQRERRRLATRLHDEHQQLLAAAKLRVSLLARGEAPQVQAACQEITALVEEALAHSRSLAQELSPPILATRNLPDALEWLARWMAEKHHLEVAVQADATAVPASEDLTGLCFQAVRELLFNVVKHAKVQTARVELTRRDDQVEILVADAGVGFDPTFLWAEGGVLGGFGLFSIRQRVELLGGTLTIASAPGQGSRFTLTVPLRPSP